MTVLPLNGSPSTMMTIKARKTAMRLWRKMRRRSMVTLRESKRTTWLWMVKRVMTLSILNRSIVDKSRYDCSFSFLFAHMMQKREIDTSIYEWVRRKRTLVSVLLSKFSISFKSIPCCIRNIHNNKLLMIWSCLVLCLLIFFYWRA